MTERVVILVSSVSSDQVQIVESRRLEDLLSSKKMSVDRIDGALIEFKEIRDKLFGISGLRGKYPQCFIVDASGEHRFIGLWEAIESLVDCDALPKETLDANPTIPTFSKVILKIAITIHTLSSSFFPAGLCQCCYYELISR